MITLPIPDSFALAAFAAAWAAYHLFVERSTRAHQGLNSLIIF